MGGCLSHAGYLLQQAIAEEDTESIKNVLHRNPNLGGWPTLIERTTAVHLAASLGRLDYLKAMVSASTSAQRRPILNRKNGFGQTALMLACKEGNVDIVRYCLGRGANPLVVDSREWTCLHYAANQGHAACVVALLSTPTPDGHRLLRDVVVQDVAGTNRYINARSAYGLTAIHLAVNNGHVQTAVELVQFGASLRGVTFGTICPNLWKPRSSLLHIAASRGYSQIARMLMTAYALHSATPPDIRLIRDSADRTPFDVAECFGYTGIAALLTPSRPLSSYKRRGPPTLKQIAAVAHRAGIQWQLDLIKHAQHSKEECPICFDSNTSLEIIHCRHQLCHDCAMQICSVAQATIPKCPFCRAVIQNVEAIKEF